MMKIFFFYVALFFSGFANAANTYGCINVKDYGAVGNNSTNDTASINAAVAAAGAATILENGNMVTKGGCINFPAGIYVVSSTITFPARISVSGDGLGGVLSSNTDSAGASVIRGTMDAPILNFPDDRFSIQNIGVSGPNFDGANLTHSICISVGPSVTKSFTMSHVYVEKCYDGIRIDGIRGVGQLSQIYSQQNTHNGITALSAQGAWTDVNLIRNGADGLYIGRGSVYPDPASPWITGLQTWGNGGYGVNVAANGFSVNQFFLNGDEAGEVFVGANASTVQISTGQLQYAGIGPSSINNTAPGIYVQAGYSQHLEIAGVQFFGNNGNDIDNQSTGGTMGITGSTFFAGGAGNVTGHMYSINTASPFTRVSNIQADHAVNLTGAWSNWSNSWISSNGTIPTFNVGGGNNHNFSGLTLYQNNASGRGFSSASGTSYSLSSVQVFGGSSSKGSVIPGFNGTP